MNKKYVIRDMHFRITFFIAARNIFAGDMFNINITFTY